MSDSATPWTIQSLGQNTGVGSLSRLRGIFPTQDLNPGLLHSLMDSVGEGEGGKIWENGIETCKISRMKRVASPGSMHDAGCLGLVHWDNPEASWLLRPELRAPKQERPL